MPLTSTMATEHGGRRIYHVGNAVLSVVVFLITVVLSMIVLDPQFSSYLLSARYRTPPIGFTERELLEGFTPVVVDAEKHTVLVVPVAGVQSARYVSRALGAFFSVDLPFASGSGAMVNNGKETEMPSRLVIALADVFSAVLLRDGVDNATQSHDTTSQRGGTVPFSTRRRSVLHLCSALSCVTPYVAQQWSDRIATASLRTHRTAYRATTFGSRTRPITNFALVFGEASESLAAMRELAEHRVLTPQFPPTRLKHRPAMPLVGRLDYADLQALCSSCKQCSYRSSVKHAQLATVLKTQAEQLPTEDSRRRLFKEWVRHNDSYSGTSTWGTVEVVPFAFVVFEDSYTLHDFSPDLVHVDVGSGDSVAALAYLKALVSATGVPEPLQPRNLLVSLFASEWVNDIVDTLLQLQVGQHYHAIPLHNSCIGLEMFDPREEWSVAHLRSWWNKSSLVGTYVSPFLEQSRATQTPLCTVLLSLQVHTLDKLLQMTSKVVRSYPPAASPVERFFYYSAGLSPADEEPLTAPPHDATDAKTSTVASASSGVGEVIGFVAQNIYFLIPVGIGFALTQNLCRRRRVCG
ncbi:hypothetical protein LPMP_351110 [Leishmania panamensis]|uniref:Uncharacterized protein n=1 Tax=Leishmania panamensis TaxID=5679 RepID=A0A088S1J7_LEIPA|nr:hypothetical protein LPMP_351110 [Leishmania panamensis]AIO02248.1 hypothetical protein LPMP_351110 [Leishmania panamensis]